jgi:hypothetical protein
MALITEIAKELKELTAIADEYRGRLAEAPGDRALILSLKTLEAQEAELQRQLREENTIRDKEVVELRLVGKKARYGTLPLHIVGGLTNSFAEVLLKTSSYIQYGSKSYSAARVNQKVDLRLAGLGTGSTVIYITGQTAPDIFGNSLMQSSLANFFELLGSGNSDALEGVIEKVGTKAIPSLVKFFRELRKDELEVDIKWQNQYDTRQSWYGSADVLGSLIQVLDKVQTNSEHVDFEGSVITLSTRGRFEIQTDQNGKIAGAFPIDLMEAIKQLHLGDRCKGTVIKITVSIPSLQKEKVQYILQNIYPFQADNDK